MNIDPSKQLTAIAAAAAIGFISGVFYDILAEIRHRKNKVFVTALCDIVFCFAVFSALFFVGYTIDEGRQKLYYVLFALSGAGVYFALIRRAAVKIITVVSSFVIYTINILFYPAILLKNSLKKFLKIFKNIFNYEKKCYKIKNRIIIPLIHSNQTNNYPVKEKTNETEKGRYYY